jgi:hypothetical protein
MHIIALEGRWKCAIRKIAHHCEYLSTQRHTTGCAILPEQLNPQMSVGFFIDKNKKPPEGGGL